MNKLWKSINDFFRGLYSRVAKVFKTDSRNNSPKTSINKSNEIVYAELNNSLLNRHKEDINRKNNQTIYTKVKGPITGKNSIYENVNLNADHIYENIHKTPPLPPKTRKQKNNINNIKCNLKSTSHNNMITTGKRSDFKYEDR